MSWPALLAYALLWLLGRLPLPALRALGAALGWLVWLLPLPQRRIARINLAACFAGLQGGELHRRVRESLVEDGRGLLETARWWTRPAAQNLALVREVHGFDAVQAALAQGRGLILAAPHLGSWELMSQWLGANLPMAIVYRPPRQSLLEPLITRGRAQANCSQIRADAGGVRAMVRWLAQGKVLGILPDQQPKAGEGLWVPFFGIPALTMTLLPRLSQRSGAAVFYACLLRRAEGQGYDLHFLPGPPALQDPDPERSATALNAGVEACVALAPAQYQWSYRRFKRRPPGEMPRDFYARRGH